MIKMKKLLVVGMSCLALSAFGQAPEKTEQAGEKTSPPAGDQTGAAHKAHAGTSKKKPAKKSKKAKQGDKMDHSKMDHSKMENMEHPDK
jgi:uncharacterized protein involved in copper resistance